MLGTASKEQLGNDKKLWKKPHESKCEPLLNSRLAAKRVMTERKDPQFYPPIHRQSISERKAVPLLDRPRRSFLPKPINSRGAPAKDNPGARKELKFEQERNFVCCTLRFEQVDGGQFAK